MHPEAVLARADSMLANGLIPEAVELLQEARMRYAKHAVIATRLADGLQVAGHLQEAVSAYADAMRIDDRSADAHYGAGCAYVALNSHGAAAAAFARACDLAPKSGAAHFNLAASLFQLGRVESAIAYFERAAQLDPELAQRARASIACIVPGSIDANNESVLRMRRLWADEEARRDEIEGRQAPPRVSSPGGKIRVGYLSAFFGSRNWMKPVFALINRHDRAAFEIHMLSDGEPPSAESGYCDSESDFVHDLRGADNDRAAAYIGEIGIDVLVDLNGYSFQSRLPLFLRRPAPRMVGWFNMFASSGVNAFDWIVGDDAVIPRGEEAHYCERIHRIRGTYLAFEILYPVPDIAPPPSAASDGVITFGCLGSHYKLTDGVLSSWARVLKAAPQALLYIKTAALDDASTRSELSARLQSRGVDPARVTMEGRSEHFQFLAAYRHVDIALDTFPYNGGTTTTEALWQGVPVLAFDGDRWASRTSKSLLLAAGLHDWVLPDLTRYEKRAVSLARDSATPAMLADLRSGMRARLKNSAACDVDGLRRAMESFYASIAVH
jgi:predicted O-linked N-acetylglucosamine transferase (SPINDLY family)